VTVPDPWLSVVIPVHDGAAHLPAALESIRREDIRDVEIIAVDDRSTDRSREILRDMSASLPLRVVEHGAGSWVAGSNLGLREARGRFACFLHQDDTWLPDRLTALRSELRSAPDTLLALHHACFIGPSGEPLGAWLCPLPTGEVPSAVVMAHLLVQNFIAIPSPVFLREEALRSGGLDEGLWYTADWDLWLRLAARGPVRFIPRILAAFRVHHKAQTVARSATVAEMHEQLRVVFERHWKRWPAPERSRRAVRRAAGFSNSLNSALAGTMRGESLRPWLLLSQFLALGPLGWRRYLRSSRIVERLLPRLRLRRQLRVRPME
jgi:glycosyltransferase involved in cell wall biosynthesis